MIWIYLILEFGYLFPQFIRNQKFQLSFKKESKFDYEYTGKDFILIKFIKSLSSVINLKMIAS